MGHFREHRDDEKAGRGRFAFLADSKHPQAHNRPGSWKYKANSGRSPHASPMPWTPSPKAPSHDTVELELRGSGRLLGRVAVPRVRDAVAANLQQLKERLKR